MLSGIWGKKIGMTQVFNENNDVVPVTVVDLANWFVMRIKTIEQDGYNAIQVGFLRNRYKNKDFSLDWLKKPKTFFQHIREIKLNIPAENFQVGEKFNPVSVLEAGNNVNVFGITKGHGFQGVVKRHGFSGGSASHGPRFGRWPGSLGFMRSQGKVIKGKKLPGHMGVVQRAIKNLAVVRVEPDNQIALIKGSIPGGLGSLVFMEKA